MRRFLSLYLALVLALATGMPLAWVIDEWRATALIAAEDASCQMVMIDE